LLPVGVTAKEVEFDAREVEPMATLIEWDGEPFAVLVDSPNGRYLVPPIVLDENGGVIHGREVLTALVKTGNTIHHPVMHAATRADLAEVDQRMARISEELGVPIIDAPPDRERRVS
jgi:hypothetical protein